MIKLRLQRKGRKKRPFYHIVVADSRSPRDGRIIEKLGRFDNVSEKKELTYNEERVIHWLRIGAQPSDTVRNILQKEGILYKMHLMRWGKNEEEIQTALDEWRSARETRDAEKDVSRKTQQKELLKTEEKEYKKQLEEKAAAAAKELEKKKEKEAKAAAAEAEEEAPAETAEDETVAKETEEPATETEAETDVQAEEEQEAVSAEAEAEVKEEDVAETEDDTKAEEIQTESAAVEVKEEETAEEVKEEPEAKAEEPEKKEEVKEEPKAEAEAKEEETKDAEPASTVSTDMNANEAIDHIKNTSLEKLKGFVPDDEERVTVQRAWESKQAE